MSSKGSIAIDCFFVYNSNFGAKEGDEHKKILFYYPPDTNVDLQIKNVGLCEAINKFTQTFNPSRPCEALHTQKIRRLIHQPEDEFWMVLTVSIPCSQKTVDGKPTIEYHGDDVQDNIYLCVLKQAYQMFRLFMGTFQSILEKFGIDNLKRRISHFYTRYIHTMAIAQADILDVFNGIVFLPLDKNTFLKVNCLVNLLEATLTEIRCTVFLYNDQLVWSGLDQEDMQTLYKYLTKSLLPTVMESDLQGNAATVASRASSTAFSHQHYGRFITGPSNLNDLSSVGKVPKVHVTISSVPSECFLIVYGALGASVCLLLDASSQVTMAFYKKLDSFLGPQLTSLASQIADVYARKCSSIPTEPQFKYIYFNHMNLAQKSTIHVDQKSGIVNVTSEVMKILADINSDLCKFQTGELLFRSLDDCWVVGKRSDEREFYVVVNQRNLIQVGDEVKKLCAMHFNKIFFQD